MTSQPSNWQTVTLSQRQKYKQKVKVVIDEAKTSGCYFCPEDDPVVLQFHHIDPESKRFNVGYSHARYGVRAVQEEIAKCIVVCSNCHLRIHAGILEVPQ